MTTWKKHDQIFRAITDALLAPKTISQSRLVMNLLLDEFKVPQTEAELIRRHVERELLRKLPINWPGKSSKKTLVTTAKKTDPISLASGLAPRAYFGYRAALYFEGSLKTLPVDMVLVTERPKPSARLQLPELEDLEPYFLHEPKKTSKIAMYEKSRFILLEREHTASLGIQKSRVNTPAGSIQIQFTNFDRSVIDGIFAPHHFGGVTELVKFIRANSKRIKARPLFDLYQMLPHRYPYWQRVGFLLENLGSSSEARQWTALTATLTKRRFFLAHGFAHGDWSYSKEWDLHYPTSVLE